MTRSRKIISPVVGYNKERKQKEMKKFSFKALTSLVLVIALLTGVFATIGVFADTPAPKAEIVYKNLQYGSSLKLMYAVTSEGLSLGDEVKVVIRDANGNVIENTVKNEEKENINGMDCDVFVSERGIAPQYIDTYVYATAQIVNGDTVVYESAPVRYSVLEYLYTVLTTSEDLDADAKAMYESLLVYANAADVALNKTEEGKRIADYRFVRAEGMTVDGTYASGTYLAGSVLDSITVPEGVTSFVLTEYDEENKVVSSETYTAADFEGYIVGDYNIVLTAGEEEVELDPTWKLVTDVSMLKEGVTIVIVAAESNYALSTEQRDNNRGQTEIVKNADGTIAAPGTNVQILTLEVGKTADTWAFNTGSGYLYAASSSKNYLRTESTLSANSSWNISVTASGIATIKATGANTRNLMSHNSQSSIFSAYAAVQKNICIYAYV